MIYLVLLLLLLKPAFVYADDFLYDTFTDTATTDLANHNGEIGGNPTWTRTVSAGATAQIASGGTRAQEIGIDSNSWAEIDATSARPSGNEFDFTATLNFVSAANTGIAISFYFVHDSTHYYRARWCYCAGDQLWSLVYVNGGGENSLGTWYQDMTTDRNITLLVKMRNADKEVLIDGVQRIYGNNDNTVPQREIVQIYWQGWGTTSAGIYLDNVTGTNVTSNPPVVSKRRGKIF